MSASESEADTVLNDSAGGLIQKREWRRAQKDASQSHPLPLSLGQVRAVASKEVLQPVGRLVNQIVRAGVMGHVINVLPADIGPRQSVIICESETEYVVTLAHQSLSGAQICSLDGLLAGGDGQLPAAALLETRQ